MSNCNCENCRKIEGKSPVMPVSFYTQFFMHVMPRATLQAAKCQMSGDMINQTILMIVCQVSLDVILEPTMPVEHQHEAYELVRESLQGEHGLLLLVAANEHAEYVSGLLEAQKTDVKTKYIFTPPDLKKEHGRLIYDAIEDAPETVRLYWKLSAVDILREF